MYTCSDSPHNAIHLLIILLQVIFAQLLLFRIDSCRVLNLVNCVNGSELEKKQCLAFKVIDNVLQSVRLLLATFSIYQANMAVNWSIA